MSILRKLDELSGERNWSALFQSNLLETIVVTLTERDKKAYDMALSLMEDWAEIEDSLEGIMDKVNEAHEDEDWAEIEESLEVIVDEVNKAHEDFDQQDEGWYDETEEDYHSSANS